MAEARRPLEQQEAPYTEAVFLESVKNGNTHLVTLFLAACMNPNLKDPYGSTALDGTRRTPLAGLEPGGNSPTN
ncbi:MAG TPA: hypothetical protein VKK81_25265 [Candidatus Binatia bacterium]|nr:hypothetical protein [Candidatus Binatia bacterium]